MDMFPSVRMETAWMAADALEEEGERRGWEGDQLDPLLARAILEMVPGTRALLDVWHPKDPMWFQSRQRGTSPFPESVAQDWFTGRSSPQPTPLMLGDKSDGPAGGNPGSSPTDVGKEQPRLAVQPRVGSQ